MPKEDVKSPEIEVVGGCEPHKRYEFWELNLGPVQEQLKLLTTEPFSQDPVTHFHIIAI